MTKTVIRNDTEVTVMLRDLIVKVNVRIWEPEDSEKVLFCVHGFAGTGEDFAPIARNLTKSGFTVIAPDVFGRGKSSFLLEDTRYTLRTYMACLNAVSGFRKAKNYYLGNSWGGVLCLAYLAGTRWSADGLILNDIPFESDTALKKFRELLAAESKMIFATREKAETHIIKTRNLGFLQGPEKKAILGERIMEIDGKWRMKYDPAVAAQFSNRGEFSLVEALSKLPVPALMLFGKDSPYALSPRLEEVNQANPRITMIKDIDDHHPPSLMKDSQILLIAGYLSQL